jgi:mRNA deadenylase 3'-5' endonuclease subunit Ccr4
MRMEPLTGAPSRTATTPKKATSSGKDNSRHDDDVVLEFNIASLNLLAESYLTPRSHPGLPRRYADVAFDPSRRRKLLLETLERFCGPSPPSAESHDDDDARKWDVLALQELDLVEAGDPILPAFEAWGYRVVRTPNDQRKDCCAIAFDESKFTLINSEVVRFDDLATLQHRAREDGIGTHDGGDIEDAAAGKEANGTSVTYHNIKPRRSNSPLELTGMVRSFLRRNCAVVAHLESVRTRQSIIVASVHLYWHPGYEYVKLCQAKYLLDFVAAFAIMEQRRATGTTTATTRQVPSVIICGDINSKPGSTVHKLFVEPHVDARTVAPWRYFWDQDNEVMYTEDDDNGSAASKEEEEGHRDRLTMESHSNKNNSNEHSNNAAPQHGRDPTVATNSDLPTVINDPEKKWEHGHVASGFPADGNIMSGLPTKFTTYCGLIDSNIDDKKDAIESETPEPITLKVYPSDARVDTNYDDFKLNQCEGLPLETTKFGMNISETSIPENDHAKSNDHANGSDDDSKESLAMRKLLKHNTPQDYQHSTPPLSVKYMLDYTLNRFTR